MYRRQPAVRAVVDFLARNVAQLNAKVYERVSNTDRLEVYDHPLAALLRNPNPAHDPLPAHVRHRRRHGDLRPGILAHDAPRAPARCRPHLAGQAARDA